MYHVPKQQWLGCAVATAAMLADRTYEEVAGHWPDLDEALTRNSRELCALLEAVTDTPWRLSPCWHPCARVAAFVPPPWPVAAWIQDDAHRPRFGQWIVVRGELIHDPGQSSAQHVARYALRDWVVTMVAEPVRPVQLEQNQYQRRVEKLGNLFPAADESYAKA
jgi:hypothetical protein